jgi:hypothetical protein
VIQVETNIARFDDDVTARIAQTYHWSLAPEQPDPARPAVITAEKAEGANVRLADRVTEKLTRSGLLAGSVAARSIRLDLDQRLGAVWNRGHISVGELWGYYCKYPYLTRLRDRSVLVEGILSSLSTLVWQFDGFALADSYDEANGRYGGLVVPSGDAHFGTVTDATLLVAHGPAEEQADRETGGSLPESGPDSHEPTITTDGPPSGDRDEEQAPENTRFFGVFSLDPDRYARDLTRVSQEVLQQLAAVEGASLEVTLEIHASAREGFPPEKVRVVLENARTLKFVQYSFDDQ